MYEMLISPVAYLLGDMKEEDKLIIVAPEVCSSLYATAKSWCEILFVFTCSTVDMWHSRVSCCPIENTAHTKTHILKVDPSFPLKAVLGLFP
jgi:hypothetical protein